MMSQSSASRLARRFHRSMKSVAQTDMKSAYSAVSTLAARSASLHCGPSTHVLLVTLVRFQ